MTPSLAVAISEHTPVLMVTIRVTDQGIQYQVLRNARFCFTYGALRSTEVFQHLPDIADRVARLMMCPFGIVIWHNFLQKLIAMNHLMSV